MATAHLRPLVGLTSRAHHSSTIKSSRHFRKQSSSLCSMRLLTRAKPISNFSPFSPMLPVYSVKNDLSVRSYGSNAVKIRVNDSVSAIENDIATMVHDEVEGLELELLEFEATKNLLKDQGYNIKEENGIARITCNKKNRQVVLEWDSSINIKVPTSDDLMQRDFEETEKYAQREDMQQDENEEQEEDAELEDEDNRIYVDVHIKNDDGKTLYVQCAVAEDGLMYLTSISSPDKDAAKMVEVANLSEQLQHRLYDFLSELGIEDRMASFIQQYNKHKVVNNLANIERYFAITTKK